MLGLRLSGYEATVLRKLLQDHLSGRPIHDFDRRLAEDLATRQFLCADCRAEHSGPCPSATSAIETPGDDDDEFSVCATLNLQFDVAFETTRAIALDPAKLLEAAKDAAQSAWDDNALFDNAFTFDADDNGITLHTYDAELAQ
jgi:hypothetical protein